jgi:hypothetical protein
MAAVREQDPNVLFEIYTTTPEWFFKNSMGNNFGYHRQVTDIGLLQTSPFHADLQLTLEKLRGFLPFDTQRIHDLSRAVLQSGCFLIICDIAPMGIAVAEAAGIPSLLIENFIWDWIYDGYQDVIPEVRTYSAYLADCFGRATYHIQTEPVCEYRPADLRVGPVSRKSRHSEKMIRGILEIQEDAPVILLTFGGVKNENDMISGLQRLKDVLFIISDTGDGIRKEGNMIRIPHDASIFHPDLIQACNAVVGKAGYSTIAEIYYAGKPFGYVTRSSFRESPVLERFIKRHMAGRSIEEAALCDGRWRDHIGELLSMSSKKPGHPNGADQIAAFILSHIDV